VSSTGSIRPGAHTAPYSAAKAGLNALTVAQAQEYGPKVRVNCIIPGPFRTDISKGWFNDEFRAHAKKDFSLERGGEPEECVGAALYFAGLASSFTSGATLVIDGNSSNPWTRSEHQMK
jgi:NAD(P)-dependent dehydrogenase (short-subunit alcohol dehydrogenase family)